MTNTSQRRLRTAPNLYHPHPFAGTAIVVSSHCQEQAIAARSAGKMRRK
jgi:hypothetical protein